MTTLLSSSSRRTLSCRTLPPIRPTRRTPAPAEPFGLGVDVPVLERWTAPGSPFTFVLTEPATDTYRYCLTTYVDGQPVAEHHYDGCYFRDHAHADADLMVAEHHEFHRQYEAERFERWMAEQDRLPAIMGGAPDDDEPTEPTWADRRWAVETSPTRDEHYEVVREGRRLHASPITDEDVQVATGAVG